MKSTILSIALALAATQANADGFRPWDERSTERIEHAVQRSADIKHTPWYFQAQERAEDSSVDGEQLEIARLGPYYEGARS